MASKTADAVYRAVTALVSAGIMAGPDAAWCRFLLSSPLGGWTQPMERGAWELLQRYRKPLLLRGVDVSALAEPVNPWAPCPTPTLAADALMGLVVRLPPGFEAGQLGELAGVSWDATDKVWLVRGTWAVLEPVLDWLRTVKGVMTGGAMDRVDQLRQGYGGEVEVTPGITEAV